MPLVLICVPHNNTPFTGCPVKGVHIIHRGLRFLFIFERRKLQC
nr:MAG TPA: hypothetical protein [Caudoviricetes sp.]